MEKEEVIQELKNQMKRYLKGGVNKEIYVEVAEAFITKHGKLIENTAFYKEFMERIPDLCLTCVDEPGDEEQKSKEFQEGMEEAYRILKDY